MCACTELVRTGIGAVCLKYSRPKWPIMMLNHTHTHTNTFTQECFVFLFLAPYTRTTHYKRHFCAEKQRKKRLASLARLIIIIFFQSSTEVKKKGVCFFRPARVGEKSQTEGENEKKPVKLHQDDISCVRYHEIPQYLKTK